MPPTLLARAGNGHQDAVQAPADPARATKGGVNRVNGYLGVTASRRRSRAESSRARRMLRWMIPGARPRPPRGHAGSGRSLEVPDAEPPRAQVHRSLHAQRRLRDARGGRRLLRSPLPDRIDPAGESGSDHISARAVSIRKKSSSRANFINKSPTFVVRFTAEAGVFCRRRDKTVPILMRFLKNFAISQSWQAMPARRHRDCSAAVGRLDRDDRRAERRRNQYTNAARPGPRTARGAQRPRHIK